MLLIAPRCLFQRLRPKLVPVAHQVDEGRSTGSSLSNSVFDENDGMSWTVESLVNRVLSEYSGRIGFILHVLVMLFLTAPFFLCLHILYAIAAYGPIGQIDDH